MEKSVWGIARFSFVESDIDFKKQKLIGLVFFLSCLCAIWFSIRLTSFYAFRGMYSDECEICGANKCDESVVLTVGNRVPSFEANSSPEN